jgi:CRISPR-associated protein Csb2
MPSYLSITVRFLQPYSHSRGHGGDPEWPPSPLRMYQALVNAAAARWNEQTRLEYAAPALRWLAAQGEPTIVAPSGAASNVKYRLYVPDNSGDLAAGAWSRGDTTRIVRRTEKDVRPVRLNGEAVHYLYPIADKVAFADYRETLFAAARSITHLGGGIDMVVGNATELTEEDAAKLAGDHWRPVDGAGGTSLRVPTAGTLDELTRKHEAFLSRLSDGGFNPVPPLSVFATVAYRRAIDPAPRPFAAFQLLKEDASSMRAFNPVRDTRRLVGMMRDAVRRAARTAGWSDEKVGTFVMGHGERNGEAHLPVQSGRFAYLLIPSIEGRGQGKSRVVGAARRIVLTSFAEGCDSEIAWARRALSGSELIEEDSEQPRAILSLIPDSDRVLQAYASKRPATTWSTVTPMILPGYDDKHSGKADELIRKAIRQAGFSDTLAEYAAIEWRKVGFWPGADLAIRYGVPEYLRNYPRYHVRIGWRNSQGVPIAIRGPICLGGGRFIGLGLFAAVED